MAKSNKSDVENLPAARISHTSENRIRFRVETKKGDPDYFSVLQALLDGEKGLGTVKTNPQTGSVLITSSTLSFELIERLGKTNRLFQFCETSPLNTTVSNLSSSPTSDGEQHLVNLIAAPVKKLNSFISEKSSGKLDLMGCVFLALVAAGGYQVLKKRFKLPPWYTAFWYAIVAFDMIAFSQGMGMTGESIQKKQQDHSPDEVVP